MALVHEHIYNSDSLADVNMAEYLTTLTKNISDSYRNNESYIRLEFKTEPVFTSLETSIPCGLVVNEVITNAMKYAFKPGTRDGIISVQIHEDEDHNVHLVLGDNGAGIDKNYIPDASKSLGTYLIQILIERQLKGTITRSSENGTVYTINFKNTSKINDIPQ